VTGVRAGPGDPEADLQVLLEETANTVRQVAPNASVRTGVQRTDAFPLSIYSTYSRSGDAADEDLVITVDVRLKPRTVIQIDIARGDGFILAEESYDCSGAADASAALAMALPGLTRFLQSSGNVLARELGQT